VSGTRVPRRTAVVRHRMDEVGYYAATACLTPPRGESAGGLTIAHSERQTEREHTLAVAVLALVETRVNAELGLGLRISPMGAGSLSDSP
jgi:hypothetical protein